MLKMSAKCQDLTNSRIITESTDTKSENNNKLAENDLIS